MLILKRHRSDKKSTQKNYRFLVNGIDKKTMRLSIPGSLQLPNQPGSQPRQESISNSYQIDKKLLWKKYLTRQIYMIYCSYDL